ncbi:hypothetical protein L7F22_057061 [Adiantum nelumboides]|nr:hypothetical protein [Adiantum nelumboides]
MAFPNFFGKQYESASNFLDDLEMAFLVSGRDEEEVKLRAFPLVLKDLAKNWFQNLEPGRKTNWETLKETFLSKYGGLDNPEHLWHRISSLHQATSRTYLTYESQFLRLWAEWEASLAEGERAPNFLKKEKFLAGLFSDLQEKVKGKFPETFEEALQIARVKDRKLEYQAHTSRVEHPQGPTMADERLPPAPTTTPEDPHLELLQRVTNQLDNLSINMVQGVRQQQPQPNTERMPNGPRRQPQRRDYFCYNCGEEGHGMYFCPHPRNFNAQAGRGRQQVTPPRARPPPQIQPQILQNPQMVAQPQVLQRSVSPQPVAEIPPLPNNNVDELLIHEKSHISDDVLARIPAHIFILKFKDVEGDSIKTTIMSREIWMPHYKPEVVNAVRAIHLEQFFQPPPWGTNYMRVHELMSSIQYDGQASLTDKDGSKVRVMITKDIINKALHFYPGQYDLLAKTKSINNEKAFIKAKGNKYKYSDMIYGELELPLRLISQHLRVQKPPRYTKPLLHIVVVMALAVANTRTIHCDYRQFHFGKPCRSKPEGLGKK